MIKTARALCPAIAMILIAVVSVSCQTDSARKPEAAKENASMAFSLTSGAFKPEGMIPSQYTCDGVNISPPLSWTNAPDSVKSFALTCDDPDAPVGDWVHWVLYDIPPTTRELAEKIANDTTLADGARHGINDFRKYGYGGPCPPGGTHRYYFKLYALDTTLNLADAVTMKSLNAAMKGHILAQAELMGKYKRK